MISPPTQHTLDPADWEAIRTLGHQMIDDMVDYQRGIGDQPVWQPLPATIRNYFDAPLPAGPAPVAEVYREFQDYVLAYNKGNVHPRFFAWVQGTGTFQAALSDLLAASLNPNVVIGEHAPMYVDRQVVDWCKQLLGFPETASGMLVSGGSMANISALTVARNAVGAAGAVRRRGLRDGDGQLVAYCSTETHSCITKAIEIIGVGSDHLRRLPVGADFRMDTAALTEHIEADLAAGHRPFCVIATAGTVNTGATDPLQEIHALCQRYGLWFHVDGAYGALAKLDPDYAGELAYLERADSLAFDLHKWLYVPYEVGCFLIRDRQLHLSAFVVNPTYARQTERGLAGGPETLNNYGFEMSRGFKALKVWMSLKEHGRDKYALLIRQNNQQAAYLGGLVAAHPELELLTPVTMSIVCYRYRGADGGAAGLDDLNAELLLRLQEAGIASPSSTVLDGRFCIRVCIVNHRTRNADLEELVVRSVEIGRRIARSAG